jgi:hypothetical protein
LSCVPLTMSVDTAPRLDFHPQFDTPPEPPFERADGCRVVGRDPSVMDFVLHWWPVLADGPSAPNVRSAAKGC